MTERTRFQFSGSFSRTHKNLVSVKLGNARLQVSWIRRYAPIRSFSSLHCFSVRTSHQISAGRTTSPAASNITAPCICPENPTHEICSPRKFPAASTLRTATPAARHQSSGRCSAHPILGEANGSCSSVADAAMCPRSSTTSARVPPVPISIPRMYEGTVQSCGSTSFGADNPATTVTLARSPASSQSRFELTMFSKRRTVGPGLYTAVGRISTICPQFLLPCTLTVVV